MKGNSFMPLKYIVFAMIFLGCTNDDPAESLDCVTGIVVGEKCNVYALQLGKNQKIPSETWQKPIDDNGDIKYQPVGSVIGLLELPAAYQREGIKLFVSLRKATAQESDVPCYTNLPPPPSPRYVVVAVDSLKCPIILSK